MTPYTSSLDTYLMETRSNHLMEYETITPPAADPYSPPGNLIFDATNNNRTNNTTYNTTFVFAEHYTLVVYLLLVILVGLIANSFVVHATLKYSTFSLDKVTILFLRHLALTDLLMVTFIGLPMLYVHLMHAGTSPFNGYLCTVLGYLYEVLVHSHIMFYLIIAGHRFVRCIFPLKLQTVTVRQGSWSCLGVWVLGVLLSGTTAVLMSGNHVEFYTGMAMCAARTVHTSWYWFNILYTLLMMVLIITLNIAILAYSTYINGRARVKSRNVAEARITVAAMSICAVLSNFWVPYHLILLGSSSGSETSGRVAEDITGQKILSHLPIVTALINPLIYTLVNRRFKMFLVKEMRRTKRVLFYRPRVQMVKQPAAEMKIRGLGFVTNSSMRTSVDVTHHVTV